MFNKPLPSPLTNYADISPVTNKEPVISVSTFIDNLSVVIDAVAGPENILFWASDVNASGGILFSLLPSPWREPLNEPLKYPVPLKVPVKFALPWTEPLNEPLNSSPTKVSPVNVSPSNEVPIYVLPLNTEDVILFVNILVAVRFSATKSVD